MQTLSPSLCLSSVGAAPAPWGCALWGQVKGGMVIYLFHHPCWPWSSKHFNRPEQVKCQPCPPQLLGTVVTSYGFSPLCLPLEEGGQTHREQVGACSREDIADFPVHLLYRNPRPGEKGGRKRRDVGLQCRGRAGHPSFQGSAGAGAHMAVKVQGESCPSLPGSGQE